MEIPAVNNASERKLCCVVTEVLERINVVPLEVTFITNIVPGIEELQSQHYSTVTGVSHSLPAVYIIIARILC